ncbi:AI-2E family transporter [Falsiroseomonas ponticola]|uniref:AI-2E family transporter n=1 Tax=Falsiroseomonas ponticola TaxID=2786951 RepID=UPI0019330DA7|nr:AI-2E family transporter [Roseomonas ponticola]
MPDSAPPSPPPGGGWRSDIAFLRRTLIVAAILVLLLALWMAREAVLLAFAAVVVAVGLLAAAAPFQRWLGRRWALAAAAGLVLAVLALGGALMGSQVQAQVSRLGEILPEAVEQAQRRLGIQLPGGGGAEGQPGGASVDPGAVGSALGRVAGFGATVVDAAAAVVLAMVGGVFLAADPGRYRRGLVMLLPRSQQRRADEAMAASGKSLRQWLLATLLSMAIVGMLAGLGAWALGLPAPLAIAIFAGLCEFVPVIGSILGAVPALLLALTIGGDTFLWTLLLFVAIQQLEGAVIAPLVTQRMVNIPPALLLLSVVAFGAIFGLAGAVLAAPLTVVAFVMVKKLYVRETLGQATEVPGERG